MNRPLRSLTAAAILTLGVGAISACDPIPTGCIGNLCSNGTVPPPPWYDRPFK